MSVVAGAFSTTTNSSGFYQFADIPVGTYTVQFSKTGYNSKSVSNVVVSSSSVTSLDDCLTVTGPPVNNTVQNLTILNGQSVCYDATQVITVAGGGTTFVVELGGVVDMIAGLSIDYLPGTQVNSGGIMHGWIAPSGPFCNTAKSTSFISNQESGNETSSVAERTGSVGIYPNPTTGTFSVAIKDLPAEENARVEVYGMTGVLLLSETFNHMATREFSLLGKPAGIYFVKVTAGDKVITSKLILTR